MARTKQLPREKWGAAGAGFLQRSVYTDDGSGSVTTVSGIPVSLLPN